MMKSRAGRPVGRFFYWPILIALIAFWGTGTSVAAAPAKTLVQDTVYRADGTVATGTLLISWPAFTTANGEVVAAGSMNVKIGAVGAVSIALVPNTGSNPASSYRVTLRSSDSVVSEEYWTVPATATTTIGAIRSKVAPSAVAQQFVGRDYVDTKLAQVQTAVPADVLRSNTTYSDPSWLSSVAANKITGKIASQSLPNTTAYTDSANTWTTPQTDMQQHTFNGPITVTNINGRYQVQSSADLGATLAALQSGCPATGCEIQIPTIDAPICTTFTITKNVHLVGTGHNQWRDLSGGPGSGGGSILRKCASLNGPAILVAAPGAILEKIQVDCAVGGTCQGDGIALSDSSYPTQGSGWVTLRDVSVFHQGRDGIRIGSDQSAVGDHNLWRLENVVSKNNARHGIYCHDHTLVNNANGGTATHVEASSNGGDGIFIDNCFGNVWTGVTVQVNTGAGVHLGPYAANNAFFGGDYDEANGAGGASGYEYTNVLIDAPATLNATQNPNSFFGISTAAYYVANNNPATIFQGGGTGHLQAVGVGGGAFTDSGSIDFMNAASLFNVGSAAQARIQGLRSGGSYKGGELSFWTNTDGGSMTHRMKIDENGNVGIGYPVGSTASKMLDVNGSVGATSFNTIVGGVSPASSGAGQIASTSVNGAQLIGNGSTCDVTLYGNNGTPALCVVHGNADVSAQNGAVNAANGFKVANVALAASHLSNGTTGSGAVVLATSPALSSATLTSPNIGVATGTSLDLGKVALSSGGVMTKYNNVATKGNGVGAIFGSVSLTAQGAAITATNLYTATAGLYRVCYDLQVTRAATTSSSVGVTIGWNNGSAQTKNSTAIATNVLNAEDGNCYVAYSTAANITYATTYASSGGTSMQYALRLTVEQLQ